MAITDLVVIVGFLVVLSAASERIVEFIKTLMNKSLGTPAGPDLPPGIPLDGREVRRRVVLQLIAFAAAWCSAAWLAVNGNGQTEFHMLGDIVIRLDDRNRITIPVVIVGLICSAGSKFWKDILEYANAVKNITEENLNLRRQQRADAIRMNNKTWRRLAMGITRNECNQRVLRVIADLTGSNKLPKSNQELEGDLGFNSIARRALASPLNEEFKDERLQLHPNDTGACDTVGDVEDKTWAKLPASAKAGEEGGPAT